VITLFAETDTGKLLGAQTYLTTMTFPIHHFLVLTLILASVARADPEGFSPPSTSPPNMIFLLADDLGWRDLACSGHQHHRTPNLDRLARQGMMFTDAHAAAPICSASRAALLTGKSPARLGYEFVPKFQAGRQNGPWPMITPDYPTELPPDTVTVASLLKAVGYATAFAGKWHLNRHQDHYLGWRPGHGPESFGFESTFDDFGSHPYGYGKPPPAPITGEAFPADTLTDKAIGFLKRDHPQPFLLWLSFYYVHDPFNSRCIDRVAWHQSQLPKGAHPKRANYAAMVETLDHEVGRVLDALDASGKAANTLVIFTSDNGGHPEVSANGPLRGSKWNLYQGGIRVPLIVRWPGKIQAESQCGDAVISMDLSATLLAAAGVSQTIACDGRSLMPCLLGKPNPALESRPLLWHFPYYQPETRFEDAKRDIGVNDFAISQSRPHAALRIGNLKLIHHFETGKDELFDLAADPSESRNVVGEQAATAAGMRGKLFDQLTAQSARLPVRKP
jgi:uncharacterized sulfatase